MTPVTPVRPEDEEGRGSSIAVVNTALRYAPVLIGVPLIAMIVAGVIGVMAESRYVVEFSLKPESKQAAGGGLMGIASEFGFDLSSLSDGESLDYYARVLQSREVLSEVLRSEYTVETEGGEEVTADLLALYDIEAPTEAMRLWGGVVRLRRDMTVVMDHAANVLTVEIEAPRRELAEQVSARLLEVLNEFNLEKRQFQARSEREFVEAQARNAAEELAAAEARLAEFLVQNRRYQNSPELVHEVDRLERIVMLRQQVYSMLAQSLEQAKLDEVRNTPVFTVLDRPEGAAREVGGLLPRLILGFVFGLVLAAAWVFIREYMASQRRRHPADFDEFDRRTRALRRIWPWSRGARGAAPAEPAPDASERESAPAYRAG